MPARLLPALRAASATVDDAALAEPASPEAGQQRSPTDRVTSGARGARPRVTCAELPPPPDEPGGVFTLLKRLRSRPPPLQRDDLLAGLAVGVMAVPQAMAYALLAGLPPSCGLYAAFLQPLIHAPLGASRQLQVGPVSMAALLTSAAVTGIAGSGATAAARVATAALLCAAAGALQAALGLLRLGGIVDLATRPIIAGFTAGAAVVVITSQAPHLLGAPQATGTSTLRTLGHMADALRSGNVHWPSFVLGVTFLGMLYAVRAVAQAFPQWSFLKASGNLIVVVASTTLTANFRLDQLGIQVIEDVPGGAPSLTDWAPLGQLPPGALLGGLPDAACALALVTFMESITVAKTLGRRHGYEVDTNQELFAVGMANALSSLFSGFAGAGSLSRSAVASDAGARTQWAAVCNSLLVGFTLALLTPLFYFLPRGVLAAIVIQAVCGLIDLEEPRALWALCRRDAVLWFVAFAGTLHTVHYGILFAVAASVALMVRDVSAPAVERLARARVPRGALGCAFVPAGGGDCVPLPDGVLALRCSGPLYGSGCAALRRAVAAAVRQHALETDAPVRVFVVDLSGVPTADSSAVAELRHCLQAMRRKGARTAAAGACPRLLRMLEHAQRQAGGGTDPQSAPQSAHADLLLQFYASLHDAVEHFAEAPPPATPDPNWEDRESDRLSGMVSPAPPFSTH
eukprot:TRINITY_DN24219_c0_g1_i1.p1 TRINITY_DN24219_c0_g1~~TRINITY_DN24219_c0_g1_i1.p1  ORF type:complete len:709 (+),score=188.79 TRINITY_DN24219_c0_g1_i1:69-2129(+)